LVGYEALGYFDPYTDLLIEIEPEIVEVIPSACSESTVVQDDKKSRYDYVIGSGSSR
jgi:hypothetical protein